MTKDKGGRPREWDREKVFEDLIEWAQKPDSINFCAFCAEQMLPPTMLIGFTKDEPRFAETYELARTFIGARRERMLNDQKLHVKAYDLNSGTYDRFLKIERQEQAAYEASLKAKEEVPANTDLLVETIEHLKSLKKD